VLSVAYPRPSLFLPFSLPVVPCPPSSDPEGKLRGEARGRDLHNTIGSLPGSIPTTNTHSLPDRRARQLLIGTFNENSL
jgi:hypothetical protein